MPKMDIKVIGGKRYLVGDRIMPKPKALKVAGDLRKAGYRSRVIKRKRGSSVAIGGKGFAF